MGKLIMAIEDEQETTEVEVEETSTDEVEVEETETEEVEETEEETEEAEVTNKSKPASEEEGKAVDDDEVIVTIGDQEPPKEETEAAPEWVRELRKAHREIQRENRELKQKLEANQNPAPQKIEVGAKPKLEDYDYDAEAFEKELTAWHERKRKADEQAAEAKREQEAQKKAWQQKLNAYSEAKSKLKVKDFDDAEATVLESLNQTQQGIIVSGADNPALVMYALGKNPDRVKELAQINDPVKFAFTVAKLEKDLKVTNRKAPPPPERTVNGTGPKSGTVDSTLERLRAEAEKTGNYSKVHQYKQQLRNKVKR